MPILYISLIHTGNRHTTKILRKLQMSDDNGKDNETVSQNDMVLKEDMFEYVNIRSKFFLSLLFFITVISAGVILPILVLLSMVLFYG